MPPRVAGQSRATYPRGQRLPSRRTVIPPLLEYVSTVSPEFEPPVHLPELIRLFERIRRGESPRALVTYPIRHRKTETVLHGLLWLLEHDPTLNIVLMTHSADRANWLGKRLRKLARRTSVGPASGTDTITDWQNDQGGGVLVMSADQSREGYNCHILLVDDPIDEKNIRLKAKRDEIDEGIDYYTLRCMRNGRMGPVILCASRFDPDDPSGRRLGRTVETWENLWQPAIIDLGLPTERAFAPSIWPLETLKSERAKMKESDPFERKFWARLQGQPRVEEGSFGMGARYDDLPSWPGYRDAIGFDLSFTNSRRSDFSSIVVGRVYQGVMYVREFVRFRAELDEALRILNNTRQVYGHLPVFSFMSGPETSIARYFATQGMSISFMPAKDPKFVRARRTIDAHNASRILYPSKHPTIASTLSRMTSFKGIEEDEDDEVDALVSLYEAMVGRGGGNTTPTRTLGQWRF